VTIVLARGTHTAPEQPIGCPTCINGCDCPSRAHGGTGGCGHYGCWGPAPTGTCYDAPRQRATTLALFSAQFGGVR